MLNSLYQGKDPRDIGIYTATEAVRYLRMPKSTSSTSQQGKLEIESC